MPNQVFSILTVLHVSDRLGHINSCLASIVEATLNLTCEIVLVCDGPVSESCHEAIRNHKDQFQSFKLIELPISLGLGNALHTGLLECSNELVARIDLDDKAHPDRFKYQIKYMTENPHVGILGTAATIIDENDDAYGHRVMPEFHEDIYMNLWACPLIHPSVMFRKSLIIEAGNYNKMLRRRQDYDLWFRCAENNIIFHNLPDKLLFYRFTKSSHKKQSIKLAWQQAMIGVKGCRRLQFSFINQAACFIPFIRSLLPLRIQHSMYSLLSKFDPRKSSSR